MTRGSFSTWTVGGDGWEWERFVDRARQLGAYRRIVDQRWSPHYTERRIEHGVIIGGVRLAVVTTRKIFRIAEGAPS